MRTSLCFFDTHSMLKLQATEQFISPKVLLGSSWDFAFISLCMPFLEWYINLTWLELWHNKRKFETIYVYENALNNQWLVSSTCTSYTNIVFIMFS